MGSASLGVLVRHVRVALCVCLSSAMQPIGSTSSLTNATEATSSWLKRSKLVIVQDSKSSGKFISLRRPNSSGTMEMTFKNCKLELARQEWTWASTKSMSSNLWWQTSVWEQRHLLTNSHNPKKRKFFKTSIFFTRIPIVLHSWNWCATKPNVKICLSPSNWRTQDLQRHVDPALEDPVPSAGSLMKLVLTVWSKFSSWHPAFDNVECQSSTASSAMVFCSKAQLFVERLMLAHGSWPPWSSGR